jgi:hypothetical protein
LNLFYFLHLIPAHFLIRYRFLFRSNLIWILPHFLRFTVACCPRWILLINSYFFKILMWSINYLNFYLLNFSQNHFSKSFFLETY